MTKTDDDKELPKPKTVKMYREGEPNEADVNVDAVADYEAGGWSKTKPKAKDEE